MVQLWENCFWSSIHKVVTRFSCHCNDLAKGKIRMTDLDGRCCEHCHGIPDFDSRQVMLGSGCTILHAPDPAHFGGRIPKTLAISMGRSCHGQAPRRRFNRVPYALLQSAPTRGNNVRNFPSGSTTAKRPPPTVTADNRRMRVVFFPLTPAVLSSCLSSSLLHRKATSVFLSTILKAQAYPTPWVARRFKSRPSWMSVTARYENHTHPSPLSQPPASLMGCPTRLSSYTSNDDPSSS